MSKDFRDSGIEPLPYTKDPEMGLAREEIKTVKIERDMQSVTVEGFRTLGVVSTFIAGVEAQCFSFVSGEDQSSPVVQAINALLLIGLLFSSFGAVTALLSARWFDLLQGDEVELLDHRWALSRAGITRNAGPQPQKRDSTLGEKYGYTEQGDLPNDRVRDQVAACIHPARNWILSKAIFLPFHLIVIGFFAFIVGIIVYTWKFQPLATAIVCTAVTGVSVIHSRSGLELNVLALQLGCVIVLCLHLDFETLGALNMMSFRRVRL
ncbi:hypothetical protein FRC12_015266 [Ceratobasidium sp. 428]|nr:hypothetical protein FRC12_015266 [Ceratobasidium sp. 428]